METNISKEALYIDLLAKAKALTEGESDTVAKMANVAALLHQGLHFWWTGFYRVITGSSATNSSSARSRDRSRASASLTERAYAELRGRKAGP